jgi:chitinase
MAENTRGDRLNREVKITAIIIVLICFQLPSALAATTDEEGPGTSPWVTGYYVGYQRDMLPPEDIDWDGLTHIAMGAVTANADGTLNTDFYIDTTSGPALARQISALAHAHNKKAILMLGGAGNGPAIHAAVQNHRASFIANIVSAMDSYGYDGIDLDWEDDVDWVLFETFAKELRQAAPGKILTLPGGAINSNYQAVDPRVVNVTKHVDQFNLMTYYPSTAWAGSGWYSWFNSPLKGVKSTTPVSIEDSLARYNASGVPKEKLGMGVGFYAIGYRDDITGPNQPTTDGSIVGGDNVYPLSKLFGTGGAYDEQYRFWDSIALEPYLSLPQPDRFGARYVSFEDEQSLMAKGAFTRENGYGGIIIWTINQGYVTSHPEPSFLLEALRAGFIEPDITRTIAVSLEPPSAYVISGDTTRFRALITGSGDRRVQWSIQEADGGTIGSSGEYSAPSTVPASTTATYHITAASFADPAKTATAVVTVGDAQALAWDPGLHRQNCAEWWMEVFADDPETVIIDVEHNGVLTRMQDWGSAGEKPLFSANIQVKSGDTIIYHATSKNGRKASTVPITFTYTTGGQILDCPVPPVLPEVIALPGLASFPTDPDHDGLYEDLNGNGRLDYADITLFFGQLDWIAANEPADAFDINRNGRADFDDIVRLFREMG